MILTGPTSGGTLSTTSAGLPSVGKSSDKALAGLIARSVHSPTRPRAPLTMPIDSHRTTSAVNLPAGSLPLPTNVTSSGPTPVKLFMST